ncbi:hypothetical protein B9G39_07030 [Zooshikella ganghwensis]|uniref:MULE transposase domain-containing protein n=1 Tax=Zooshikella ganghwensis TaxID=202772 RepID=A0A4P9VMR2_9GAMM|nr:hypothetical protein B9G39_07030 [Zooshikella ganghwensis]
MKEINSLVKKFCSDETWVLCLDHTNLNFGLLKINFMVLAIEHERLAIFLFGVLLLKKRNSNAEECKALINSSLNVLCYST